MNLLINLENITSHIHPLTASKQDHFNFIYLSTRDYRKTDNHLLLFFPFRGCYSRSPFSISLCLLHLPLSYKQTACLFSPSISRNLIFSLPCFLLPTSSICCIHLTIHPLSLLFMHPNHLSLASFLSTCYSVAMDTVDLLNTHFQLLPSGHRYRIWKWRRGCSNRGFVPSAISIMN